MRLRPRINVDWFPRRWPYFSIGFHRGEFHLYLWFVEIDVWRSY
jgi:hypothetical protein